MFRFVRELVRDFIPAYKQLFKHAFIKKRRAAPFNTAPLRPPGWSTLGELISRVVYSTVVFGVIIGLYIAPIVFLIAASVWDGFNPLSFLLFIALPASALLPVIFFQIRNHRLGYRGEGIVAEALAEYVRSPSWRLFHSVEIPQWGGDIDHVLVCSRGVFCIETKTYRGAGGKKITAQEDKVLLGNREYFVKGAIKQTRGAALHLHNFLKSKQRQPGRVKSVVLFVDDNDNSFCFANNGELIVGKSSAINDIFDKIKDTEKMLDSEEIDAIGKVLAEGNRISTED